MKYLTLKYVLYFRFLKVAPLLASSGRHLKWVSLHRCAAPGFISGISCLINRVGTISWVDTQLTALLDNC